MSHVCKHTTLFTSAEDAGCFHKTTERAACQKSAPLVLHPHCSFLRHTRCIIYGFCHCLHMQQLLWNLQQKLSKMVIVSFLVVPGIFFNSAVGCVAVNLDSMADRCQLSSLFSFLQRGSMLAENINSKWARKSISRGFDEQNIQAT